MHISFYTIDVTLMEMYTSSEHTSEPTAFYTIECVKIFILKTKLVQCFTLCRGSKDNRSGRPFIFLQNVSCRLTEGCIGCFPGIERKCVFLPSSSPQASLVTNGFCFRKINSNRYLYFLSLLSSFLLNTFW